MKTVRSKRLGNLMFLGGLLVLCAAAIVLMFLNGCAAGGGTALPPSSTSTAPLTTNQATVYQGLQQAAAIANAIATAQPGTPWGAIAGVIGGVLLLGGGLYVHNNAVTALASSTPTPTAATPPKTS